MMSSVQIKQFPFNSITPDLIDREKEFNKVKWHNNWPIIYIINNDSEVYVGETYKIKDRIKQHLFNDNKVKLTKISLIIDDTSNKSYTLDIEASLIRYMAADGKFKLQNGNRGLVDYNYFNKADYRKKLEKIIWPKLKDLNLVRRNLRDIQNDDVFKYSPYVQLGINQHEIITEILKNLSNNEFTNGSILIKGSAGTGKTVLGSYLMKLLHSKSESFEEDLIKDSLNHIQHFVKKVGFVIPQQSLRKTLKRVFRNIQGVSPWMVLSPNDVAKSKQEFDLLIIDEAHRLRQRKNLSNYGHYDENNKNLKLSWNATELDWILAKSKYQIFFYDKEQSIKPTDIPFEYFEKNMIGRLLYSHELFSQFRVMGGEDYIKYVKKVLNCEINEKKKFGNYEFKIFDDIKELQKTIKQKNTEFELCRLIAGYGWKWVSKSDKDKHDIEIGNNKFIWNTTGTDWINSKNSINEIGCIHTVQGYDLTYAGVIIGPEVTYSEKENKIKIIKENYYDTNGKIGIDDAKELEQYIKNIYGVLLTRGIRGTYVYVVDEKLRNYLKRFIDSV